MDNTFVIQEAKHSQQLLQHINSQDPNIQFTIEEPNQEGALSLMDTLVSPGPNNTLITTHTDQYLHRDSNHLITAKNNVFSSLAHRDKVVSINQQALHKEMEHIRKAFQTCSFPPWALNILHNKFNHKHNIHNGQPSTDNQANNNNSGVNNNNKKNISIVGPYIHGLGERLKRTCNNMGSG